LSSSSSNDCESQGNLFAGLVDQAALPQGRLSGSLAVSRALAETALRRWSPVVHTGTGVPEEIRAGSMQELHRVPALLRYSDGSVRKKQIDWDPDTVCFDRPGACTARGTVSSRIITGQRSNA
jgi:hypothetical protein